MKANLLIHSLLKKTPIIGRYVRRYDRAIQMVMDESSDSLEEALAGLDDDDFWDEREKFDLRQAAYRASLPPSPPYHVKVDFVRDEVSLVNLEVL